MTIEFKKHYNFSFTPQEFLDMVWVYRNEISPALESISGTLDDIGKYNQKDILFYARTGILNNDLREAFPTYVDFLCFKIISKDFFAMFHDAKDKNIRKPCYERICKARDSFADILQSPLPSLTSDLVDGKIQMRLTCK